MISNLDHGVTTSDIQVNCLKTLKRSRYVRYCFQELFECIGAVRSAHVHFDEHGRSLGTAEVTYERRADASAAQQKYNTLKLDGSCRLLDSFGKCLVCVLFLFRPSNGHSIDWKG
jgi:hypothetical protein